jgi:hypothetical protein
MKRRMQSRLLAVVLTAASASAMAQVTIGEAEAALQVSQYELRSLMAAFNYEPLAEEARYVGEYHHLTLVLNDGARCAVMSLTDLPAALGDNYLIADRPVRVSGYRSPPGRYWWYYQYFDCEVLLTRITVTGK